MRRILVGASLRFGGRRIVRAPTERDLSKIAHTSRPHRRANSAQDHVDVLGRDTCVPQSFEPRPAAAVNVRACALLVVAAAGVHQHGKAVPPDQEALDGDDQGFRSSRPENAARAKHGSDRDALACSR